MNARYRAGGVLCLAVVVMLTVAAVPSLADPVGQITEFSSGLNSSGLPFGIAPGADGSLWFADEGATSAIGRIGRITPSGQITEYSSGLNSTSAPVDITAGPDGNVWFTDLGITGGDWADHAVGSDHRVLKWPELRQHAV
jgi:streptogramin lyase